MTDDFAVLAKYGYKFFGSVFPILLFGSIMYGTLKIGENANIVLGLGYFLGMCTLTSLYLPLVLFKEKFFDESLSGDAFRFAYMMCGFAVTMIINKFIV